MNRFICIVFSLALILLFTVNTADAGPQKARAQSKSSVNTPSRKAGAGNKANNNRGNNNRGNNNNNNRNTNKNVNNNKNVNRNKNTNVNRNTNIDIDRDIDVDIDVDHRGGYYGGGCCYHDNYHPIATAAAITATAMIVGSIVYSLPPNCTTVIVNGFAYRQCGSTWYQPQISGSSTTYIVVNNPPGY